MSYTALGEVLTAFFIDASSPRTFPSIVYLYSGVLNYFVPSGGSKWIVEASYLIPAGQTLGLSIPTVTLSYAYGDMTTNLLQPFWANSHSHRCRAALWRYYGLLLALGRISGRV